MYNPGTKVASQRDPLKKPNCCEFNTVYYWPAPAKLNLFLHLTGRRADHYHELQTVFQLIDYCDELSFTQRSDPQINCTCLSLLNPVSAAVIPDEDNLAIKAARLLQDRNKNSPGVDILIKKRIPIGGGLGGGSSNAATTLVVLNHLWNMHLSLEELLNLGITLGADVPIFIQGESSWAEGIGEKLQAIPLPETWFVVMIPPLTISTAKLFSHPRLTYNTTPIKIQTFLSGSLNTHNDFEHIVRQDYPMIAEGLDFLNHYAPARLSGTGACIFATLKSKIAAETLLEKIKAPYQGFVCKGLTTSPLQQIMKNWGVAKW